MESMTKNRQSREIICRMIEKYMSPLKMTDCKELTGGLFNAVYEVYLSDESSVILKIAPPKEVEVQIYEKNIMNTEVLTMETLSQYDNIPVPHVYGYDDSCAICASPYFVMEKLKGESISKIRDTLSQEQIDNLYLETGKIIRAVHNIACPCFGFPAQREYQGDKWYSVFCKMMTAAIEDARRTNVTLEVPPDKLMNKLTHDKAFFDEVTEPHLIHFDCWDGNIFVENGKIAGIIDWERTLWADPLMEVQFRRFYPNLVFQNGYGLGEMTENQIRRALWYDVYMMVLIASECEFRKYDINDVYGWAAGVLKKQFDELQQCAL